MIAEYPVTAVLEVLPVTTACDLERLQPEWEALWARCPRATPFQAPAWLVPWWRAFRPGTLSTLELRHDGRLVGLAPLFVREEPEATTRTLRLLGAGNTDYLDVLVEPEFEEEGARALLAYLDAHRDDWDVLDLQQLRPESPLLHVRAPDGWSDALDEQAVCPVLQVPEEAGTCEDVLPAGFLKKLHYYRRRTAREGEVRLERATEWNFEELFEALRRLHRARWEERDEPGMLAHDAVSRFHEEAAPMLLAQGLLRLYGLRFDGRIVASYYGLTHGRRAYYYLSGFDPTFDKLSLGSQIVHYALEEALREGVKSFDFMRGQEDYKYRWGAENRQNYRRRLRHPASDPAP